MTEYSGLTFSQREGFEEAPRQLRLKELPVEARTMIWNILYEQIESTRQVVLPSFPNVAPSYRVTNVGDVWEEILKDKHLFLDFRSLDEWNNSFDKRCAEIKDRILSDPFNRVFDLIEFIMRHRRCPLEFVGQMSWVFSQFKLAYLIDSGPPAAILPAATEAEGNELRRNLAELRTVGLEGCETHLRNASKCINDGDSAGSVRESIHAVESVAKLIAPDATTLGAALHALERHGVLHHKALKEALGKLYGYTSNEQGIRHALLDKAQADVTIDEAVFMLGACASFASYLWRKHKAADAP